MIYSTTLLTQEYKDIQCVINILEIRRDQERAKEKREELDIAIDDLYEQLSHIEDKLLTEVLRRRTIRKINGQAIGLFDED